MNLELVKNIADAVLYEGYILYPYRASAVKNRQRFNFGVLVPRSYAEEQDGSEACTMRTECVVEGDEPVIDVRVRFLHLVSREVFQLPTSQAGTVDDGQGEEQPVEVLKVGGKAYHAWQEAVEREVVIEDQELNTFVAEPRKIEFEYEPRVTSEVLYDEHDRPVGKLVRRQHLVRGSVTIGAKSHHNGVARVSVEIENTAPCEAGCTTRDEALLQSLASTHTILGVRGGMFVSMIDPPESFSDVAAACNNVGAWPVLVGEEGQRDTMLSSPIILYDYPQIAPESGGDFFDGTEIDEMLALRVMTLTDEEKREMQDVDDRARQVLERTESLSPEHWQKLHGAIRGLKTVQQTSAPHE